MINSWNVRLMRKHCILSVVIMIFWISKPTMEFRSSQQRSFVKSICKYRTFKEAVYMMQKYLEKERILTIKELDQYLWKAMDMQIQSFKMT